MTVSLPPPPNAAPQLWKSIAIGLWISIASCGGEKLVFQELPLGIPADTLLTSHENVRENPAISLGKANLLFFGYTRCPDFCPVTLHKIETAIKGNSALQKALRLIFVSVDSKRETPADLKRYLAQYPYARGYTGTPAEIQKLEKAFGSYSAPEPDGRLSHSLYIYLVNEKGKVVFLLRHDDPAEKIRRALEQLLS